MSEQLLRLDHITMQFGGVVAVDDLELEVNEGEIVALIGPNGAGKTTAFNVITGVYQPTNGAVWFDGAKIIENHPQGKMKKQYKGQCDGLFTETLSPTPDKITRAGMARTFQNIRLWKTQTVFDNVLIAKHCRSTSSVFSAAFRLNRKEEAAQRAQVEELLEIVGLSDVKNELATSLPYGKQRRLEIARALAAEPKLLLLDEPAAGMNPQETEELTAFIGVYSLFPRLEERSWQLAGTLSGGEQQMLAVGRALMSRPKLMMLDEPSLGLAPLVVQDIFSIIREINRQGVTVLLVEQNANMALKTADLAYVLETGTITMSGTGAELLADSRVKEAYLGKSS